MICRYFGFLSFSCWGVTDCFNDSGTQQRNLPLHTVSRLRLCVLDLFFPAATSETLLDVCETPASLLFSRDVGGPRLESILQHQVRYCVSTVYTYHSRLQ